MLYEYAILFVFPAAMIFAGAMDLFTMTIPNRISLLLVIAFIILAPFSGLSMGDIGAHILAGLLVLAITFSLFSFGYLGGGDAKILSVAALWLGFEHMGAFLIWVALLGGVLAVGFLIMRKMPMPSFLLRQEWALRLYEPQGGIPYGVALGAAALIIYPSTFWFMAAL